MVPIALAIQQAISMLMMMKYLRKFILINVFFRFFQALSVTTIFIIFVILLQDLHPILVPVTTAVLALPAITIASGINRDDRNTLKRLLK